MRKMFVPRISYSCRTQGTAEPHSAEGSAEVVFDWWRSMFELIEQLTQLQPMELQSVASTLSCKRVLT